MQSKIVALLLPHGGRNATLLFRRPDGAFALRGIDPRLASATRVASNWGGPGAAIVDTVNSSVVGYKVAETN